MAWVSILVPQIERVVVHEAVPLGFYKVHWDFNIPGQGVALLAVPLETWELAFVVVAPLCVYVLCLFLFVLVCVVRIFFSCAQLCQIFEGVLCKCEINRDENNTAD